MTVGEMTSGAQSFVTVNQVFRAKSSQEDAQEVKTCKLSVALLVADK